MENLQYPLNAFIPSLSLELEAPPKFWEPKGFEGR